MQKNKVLKTLIVTLSLLFLGIFCKMKTVEAINFNIYDPRTDQHYQVHLSRNLVCDRNCLFRSAFVKVNEKLAEATNLPKNLSKSLFLIDESDLRDKASYDLELPIEQIVKDGVIYNIYLNQKVVVAGLVDDNLEDQEVVIASKIKKQKVTQISTVAFKHTKIRSVIFEPNSVITSIGKLCFDDCQSLTNVTLPDSLKSIGYGCFSGCRSLANITLPNSLTSIGNRCFLGCQSLTSITLPNSITKIGESCFAGCQSLTNVTFPDSIKSIRRSWWHSYHNCSGFHSRSCFSGCQSLTSITLPNSITNIEDYCFHGCCSLKEINLPNSLTGISFYAFLGCTSLQQINLGNYSQLQDLDQGVFNTKSLLKYLKSCYN